MWSRFVTTEIRFRSDGRTVDCGPAPKVSSKIIWKSLLRHVSSVSVADVRQVISYERRSIVTATSWKGLRERCCSKTNSSPFNCATYFWSRFNNFGHLYDGFCHFVYSISHSWSMCSIVQIFQRVFGRELFWSWNLRASPFWRKHGKWLLEVLGWIKYTNVSGNV